MSNQFSFRNINLPSKQSYDNHLHFNQKIKQVYISSTSEFRPDREKQLKHSAHLSPNKISKNDSTKGSQSLPPKNNFFRRTKNDHNDHHEDRSNRDTSQNKNKNTIKVSQLEIRSELQLKVYALEKKLNNETQEKHQLQEKLDIATTQNFIFQNNNQNILSEINKIRYEKCQKEQENDLLKNKMFTLQSNYVEAKKNIEELKQIIKENKLNQKSLQNLKGIQNQIDILNEKNKKMDEENKQLNKIIKNFNLQRQSQQKIKEKVDHERVKQLESEIKQLKDQLNKNKSEREFFLESQFFEIERKLYDREKEIKKLEIKISCSDRKKLISIDDVKYKKDEEIKDLRKKFMKVSKDLKETKDKIEKRKNSNPKEHALIRKVKSAKMLGMTSQSEEITFEFSSEA